MKEVFSIANKGIKKADNIMNNSMDSYVNTLKLSLQNSKELGIDLDQTLKLADSLYNLDHAAAPGLMQMRAGAIEIQDSDPKKLLNKMTVIHSNLKQLEKNGIDGHFGDSCIGTEYWLRYYKVKGVLSLSK